MVLEELHDTQKVAKDSENWMSLNPLKPLLPPLKVQKFYAETKEIH